VKIPTRLINLRISVGRVPGRACTAIPFVITTEAPKKPHIFFILSPHSLPTNNRLQFHRKHDLYYSEKHIKMFKRVLTAAPAHASRALQTAARPTTASFARTVAPLAQQPAARRSYHEKVLDHYNNPRNVGSMAKNEQDVGTGLVGAPACGDVMKIQIKVDPKDERITDVKFKTFGCGSAIASSSYLTELVKGMTLEQAGRIRNTEIAKELCLPPVKCKWRTSHTHTIFLMDINADE
jgi:iron-sulfur cluster assembly enzyme ISCU, mitochondrial